MNGFKFCVRLYFFFAVCSFGIVHALEVSSAKSKSPFMFGGTYDNSSFYRAESPTCLEPEFLKKISENVTLSNNSEIIGQSMGSSKMSKERSTTTSTTVSVLWGLASETTTNTTSTRTDNYSLAVNYTRDATSIALVNLYIPSLEAGLNSEARKLYDGINIAIANQEPNIARERYNQFRQMCGTGIITQMDAGFKFSFTLIFNFVSVTEKDGAVKISGISTFADAIKLVKSRGRISPDTKITFSLDVVATQLGGDPEELAELLKSSGGSVKQDGSTFSLRCKLGTTGDNPCADLITTLELYGGRIGNQVRVKGQDCNDKLSCFNDKLYFSNPSELKYEHEANGADFTKITNVNKEEQNRLWKQYLADEKTNRYISKYLNYLNYIKALYITKPSDLAEDKSQSEERIRELNDLIDKLQTIKVEYANIIKLYNSPNAKGLIKNCFADVTRSCKSSSDKIFELRAQQFKDKVRTDKLLNYLMNSEYVGDFYIKKNTITRCNLMPISDIMPSHDSNDGLYFADCQKFNEEKPSFVMTIRYKGSGTSDIKDFHYVVGDKVFYYAGYNQKVLEKNTEDITPETSDVDSSNNSASLEGEYLSNYLGTMTLTIVPKVFLDAPRYGERRGYDPRSNYAPEYVPSGLPVTIIDDLTVNIFRLVE